MQGTKEKPKLLLEKATSHLNPKVADEDELWSREGFQRAYPTTLTKLCSRQTKNKGKRNNKSNTNHSQVELLEITNMNESQTFWVVEVSMQGDAESWLKDKLC